jgi:glycogen debranching enzyme
MSGGAGEQSVAGAASSGTITLVERTSVAASSVAGDIVPGAADGLFFGSTRFVSRWQLRLDETELQSLTTVAHGASAATFVARRLPPPGTPDSPILVTRRRTVGGGMREEITLENAGAAPVTCALRFEVDADFARLLDVKAGRRRRRSARHVEVTPSSLIFSSGPQATAERLEVRFSAGSTITTTGANRIVELAAGTSLACSVEFVIAIAGRAVDLDVAASSSPGDDNEPTRAWRASLPRLVAHDAALTTILARSAEDLRALRIFCRPGADESVFAAGAPWYTTLFGRDALLTSLMTLGLAPSSARATLRVLARFQGERADAATAEAPGKILHHLRGSFDFLEDAGSIAAHYGSVDATPLFVVLLGALQRWGLLDEAALGELLPHADRALGWIDAAGDLDGDGFVEYEMGRSPALVNQGWKDSVDSTTFGDGRLATGPIALAEVQGYVYAAYRARAELALAFDDESTAADYRARATRLKAAFNERFWLPAHGYFAMGLDGDKQPIDAISSNIGHCLWTGVVDADRAPAVAAQLLAPAMFSGWGVRTLSTEMAAYNPVSYHNGSVWPHDSAICAAGLMRYGFVEESHAITLGLLDAAAAFDGHLPELFCGFERAKFPTPVGYPNACAPQAWAAATPFFLLLSTVFRFDPGRHNAGIGAAPTVPPGLGAVRIENLAVGRKSLTLDTEPQRVATGGITVEIPRVPHRPEGI